MGRVRVAFKPCHAGVVLHCVFHVDTRMVWRLDRVSTHHILHRIRIFEGVQSYFDRQPPAGTWLAWQQQKGNVGKPAEYVIDKGDTLSGIAKRHNVSVKALLEFNRLTDASIRVGQTIKIPAS